MRARDREWRQPYLSYRAHISAGKNGKVTPCGLG